MRWVCTKSGYDASDGIDCGLQGSANNPYTCSTTNCPAPTGAGNACCRPTKPTGTWAISSPEVLSGTMFEFTPEEYVYANAMCWSLSVQYVRAPPSCAGVGLAFISLSLDRSKVSPGGTFTLPTAGVTLSTVNTDEQKSCSTWTGTVKWDSDAPSWKVTINATCTTPSTFNLAATLSGDL